MTCDVLSVSNIQNYIVKGRGCSFEFGPVNTAKVEELLLSIQNEKPSGMDNLDGKLLKISTHLVASF
uniref:Uncharacterized protein n=1 Tax=Anguilla anguilla TaxID=7936 RepID=A0A0E9TAR8_ANGAN